APPRAPAGRRRLLLEPGGEAGFSSAADDSPPGARRERPDREGGRRSLGSPRRPVQRRVDALPLRLALSGHGAPRGEREPTDRGRDPEGAADPAAIRLAPPRALDQRAPRTPRGRGEGDGPSHRAGGGEQRLHRGPRGREVVAGRPRAASG